MLHAFAKQEILMVANPVRYAEQAKAPNEILTIVVDKNDFFRHPIAAQAFLNCWHDCFNEQSFHSPHKMFGNILDGQYIIAALTSNYQHSPHQLGKNPLNICDDPAQYIGFGILTCNHYRRIHHMHTPYTIEQVMVRSGCRHRGFGTAVMHKLMVEAAQKNIQKIFLTCSCMVTSHRIHLPTFYGTFGFREVLPTAD